jgi:hypothetical protein
LFILKYPSDVWKKGKLVFNIFVSRASFVM